MLKTLLKRREGAAQVQVLKLHSRRHSRRKRRRTYRMAQLLQGTHCNLHRTKRGSHPQLKKSTLIKLIHQSLKTHRQLVKVSMELDLASKQRSKQPIKRRRVAMQNPIKNNKASRFLFQIKGPLLLLSRCQITLQVSHFRK